MPAAIQANAPSGLDDAIVEAIAGDKVRVLPLPATTTKLMSLVNSGDFSLRQVSDVVAQDQALAAYVLRQASSAAKAGRAIDSLEEAVAVLGAKDTMSMAVALGVGSQMCGGGPLQALKLEVWRYSTFCASFCRELAPHFKVAPEQAFLVGLLSNFGRSVALSCIEDALPKDGCPPMPREFWLDVVERHERDLGLVMAAKWDLPQFVSNALSALRRRGALPKQALARLVTIGNEVAALADTVPQPTDEVLARIPGLDDAGARAAVLVALQKIGGEMWSLNPAEPKPADPKKSVVAVSQAPLAVAVREIESHGPAKISDEVKATSVELDVTLHQAKGTTDFRCIAMTHEGLVMITNRAMPPNWMVRLSLQSDPNITFCGTVVHCAGRDKEHLVGVRRMSLAAEDQLRWTRLVAGPEAAQVPASVREAEPVNDQAPPKKMSAKVNAQTAKQGGKAGRPAPRTTAGGGASLHEGSGPPKAVIAAVVAAVALAGVIAAFVVL